MQMFAILAMTRLDEAAAPEAAAAHRPNMSGGIPAPPASYIPPTGASFLTFDPTHPGRPDTAPDNSGGSAQQHWGRSDASAGRGLACDTPVELWMGHREEKEDAAAGASDRDVVPVG